MTLAHTDSALRTMRWRAEVNKLQNIDSERHRPRRRQAAGAEPRHVDRRPLPDPRRALPPARAASSATTPSCGGTPAPPTTRGRDAPEDRGARHPGRGRRRTRRQGPGRHGHRRPHEPRRHRRPDRRQLHRRMGDADLRHGRRRPADLAPAAPGRGHRAGQGLPADRRRSRVAARLRQPDRPRRAGLRRVGRPVQHLQHPRLARVHRGARRPRARADARRSPACGCSASGRAVRHDPGLLARHGVHPGRRDSCATSAGAPTGSRPARSSASRWPRRSPPADAEADRAVRALPIRAGDLVGEKGAAAVGH